MQQISTIFIIRQLSRFMIEVYKSFNCNSINQEGSFFVSIGQNLCKHFILNFHNSLAQLYLIC